MNLNDDLCIKRKLLFDGRFGDDSRINMIQKMIVQWLLSKNYSSEDNQIAYNRICYQLSILEHSKLKSQLIHKNYQEEFLRYQKFINEMEQNIKNINKTIESSKVLLLEIQKVKQCKLNYEMIAREISLHPSRQETSTHIRQLQQSISEMNLLKKELDDEWCKWKNHGAVIITNSLQLQSIVEQSEVCNLN